MKIAIAGITGFIGSNMNTFFKGKGYKIISIDRKDFENIYILTDKLEKADAVLNFIGVSVFGFWTRRRKRKILNSRLDTTKKIVEAINSIGKNKVLINASAVGLYDKKMKHDEFSKEFSHNYLTEIINKWENMAEKANKDIIRLVIIRMGIILGKNGGFLKWINAMMKFGVIFIMGRKEQLIPICSLNELFGIVDFILNNKKIVGVINAVNNYTISNKEFYNKLLRKRKGILFFWLPPGLVRLVFGEAAVMLLEGQNVIPRILLDSGYMFKERSIEETFESLV